MKKFVILCLIGVALSFYYKENPQAFQLIESAYSSEYSRSDNTLKRAFDNHQSDLQVAGTGTVMRVLRDDLKGRRHQRFILKLSTGQTLLVAHNIDLAPRINSLSVGNKVEFYGEYEWNSKGGVIHWTHKDPQGRHEGGWLRHDGRVYE